ncbi:MAG: ABC transporter ATP-binding protein, partial [Candidatus Delongbacteria bacterium]|nr:ABC transporter ATP-binding protein [Candidatus Delongbacteria bacterium]
MPTSSDIPAINIQNLSKSYRLCNKKGNTVKALDNVSLNINQGEVVGIIGPNGSGKSTLLKILSEITAPDSGTIKIHGKVASILEVGTGFNPDLSVLKNIYLNARLHGMKKKEVDEKFDAIVELFGFRHFLDTPVKQYSSGMYMRLAFAVVVYIDADIYLFDEILSVGDLTFQNKIIDRIKMLNNKNKTICIVTHAPNIIAEFVNRISLLMKGKITNTGHPNEVIYKY